MSVVSWFLVAILAGPTDVPVAPVAPADPVIVLPTAPVAPPPAPPPVPAGTVPVLKTGVLYDIVCKTPCAVRVHPAAVVTVTKETIAAGNSLKIRADFVDGAKSRTYVGPCTVYFIEGVPQQSGRIEIDVIPFGLKAETDIKSATVDVDGGQAPQPPPPPPGPPTPADPLVGLLQAAYDAEPNSVSDADGVYLKAADKTLLAAAFRALAVAVKDPAVKNGDDNFALIHRSIESIVKKRLAVKLRPVCGAEINKVLPNGPGKGAVALSDQNRKDAADLYLRLAAALEKVK